MNGQYIGLIEDWWLQKEVLRDKAENADCDHMMEDFNAILASLGFFLWFYSEFLKVYKVGSYLIRMYTLGKVLMHQILIMRNYNITKR
jgi:hypothetical protein